MRRPFFRPEAGEPHATIPVAANPLGEEKSPTQGRGSTPTRIVTVVALAAVVIALALVLFGGNGSHQYDLVFQNASQLVKGNQVLIGGQAVGSVESIDLTEDNLAEVHVKIEQRLHEGSTAIIRATSLAGVANHYISISPGPNSNPELDDGATIDLDSTTTPIDLDLLLNTFPAPVRRSLSMFIRGNAEVFKGYGREANQTYKYFGPALNRATAFTRELSADQRLFERFVVSSSKLATVVSSRDGELASAIANASTAFGAIASQNRAFSETLRLLPPVFRQSNTTFVNLRAALDDLDPLIEASKPATKDLAPFLREFRPVISKAVPVFKDLRLTVRRDGFANDAEELLGALPAVHQRAASSFPHAEDAIADFQPNLNFARAYTPDIFNGFGKVGEITGYYDANGHYARTQFAALNLFSYNSATGELEPIPPSQQYDAFGGSAGSRRPCPGAATQPAPDGSNPFTNPPFAGSSVSPAECDPTDVPPGP